MLDKWKEHFFLEKRNNNYVYKELYVISLRNIIIFYFVFTIGCYIICFSTFFFSFFSFLYFFLSLKNNMERERKIKKNSHDFLCNKTAIFVAEWEKETKDKSLLKSLKIIGLPSWRHVILMLLCEGCIFRQSLWKLHSVSFFIFFILKICCFSFACPC